MLRFFAPLDIPNFKQANVPDVHSTSLQLQRRIINLESQVEQLKASEGLSLLKIKQLKDEIYDYKDRLAKTQKENATLLTELTLIKKQKQPLPASQQNLQSTSNNAGSRDTRLNVFRSNQQSKRIDLFPRSSVTAINNNASLTSSDKPFIRRSNSVANLNTQQKQQANNFTDDFHIHSTFNNKELSLNQKFELPSRMVNTLYERTSRGEEFTFL
uniref:Uncharacterized protein n=1 Tax=Meloidogyne enterolobii TaxID=390850 RepID=A0A6V7UL00_MELEN|nr:unnamed protein product [Meloidogyne enterolobii]